MFLRSIRATLLTAVSIPLSLIITFVFLHLTGDTLNLMSLGGLAVAIGLIIDDSVVVVENIARHLAEGQSGDEAIDRASREISGAVIGSTLTTILVFLPLAFVHGVVGQFFQSLSLSLTVALLGLDGREPHDHSRAGVALPGQSGHARQRADLPRDGRRLRAGSPPGAALAAAGDLAGPPGRHSRLRGSTADLKIGFMPDMDEGAFVLDYFMPAGTSLAETNQVARRIDKVLSEMPDVSGYLRRTGAENGIYATEVFRGDIEVALKPPGQRRPIDAIFKWLRKELKDKVPEARTELNPLIQDQIDDLTGVSRPVEVKVFGPDAPTLRGLAGPDRRAGGEGRAPRTSTPTSTSAIPT